MGSFITDDIYKSDLTAEQIEAAVLAVHNKTITAADVGAVNPNLLINGDFRNPVNQRGLSVYVCNGVYPEYTIDGLKALGTVTVVSGSHVNLSSADSAYGFGQFQFTVENGALLAGESVTVSVEVDGIIYSGTATVGTEQAFITQPNWWLHGMVDGGHYTLILHVNASQNLNVSYIKPELGPVATPFVPEKPGRTLADCKYFYRLWATEAARTEALKEIGLMRLTFPTLGTIVISGTTYYYADAELY